MGWKKQLPWVTRPLGRLPDNFREHGRVLFQALRDLPRTIREDATVEMAAGMSFFLLFSLFPGILFLTTLLPYLPVDAPVEQLLSQGLEQKLLPQEVYTLLNGHIDGLINQPRTGLLTLSAAIALFSASRALVSLSRSLNRSYRVPKIRSEALRRIKSMVLTTGTLGAVVIAVLALSLGDWNIEQVIARNLIPVSSGTLIIVVRWPLLLLLGAFGIQQLYYLLPDVRPRWRPISTGSIFAVLGWVVATRLFTDFASRLIEFNFTYGSLSSVAVVMAWMYLACFALMAGGVLNALIDRGLPPEVTGDGPVPELFETGQARQSE
ncbi:MAG: YihY/virulence factor BrkB family protein [Myxococcota bacterium]|nr:YihY/virulence factor BrkB family protein [Myxococcota bacterium]